jgi:hypothetical protein
MRTPCRYLGEEIIPLLHVCVLHGMCQPSGVIEPSFPVYLCQKCPDYQRNQSCKPKGKLDQTEGK